jgi:hypothetical protein
MLVALAAPVFVLAWIIYEDKTIAGELTEQISSAVTPAVVSFLAASFVA